MHARLHAVLPTLSLIIASSLVLLAPACRQNEDGATKEVAASAPAPAAPAPAATEEESAVPPVTIAGAYLAQCSGDTGESFVKDETIRQSLTACLLTDAGGARVEAVVSGVTVVIDGQTVEPELVPASDPKTPWHVGFKLDPVQALKATELAVSFQDPNAAFAVAKTDNTAFDWQTHPAFAAIVEVIKGFAAAFYLPATFGSWEAMRGCEAANGKCHLLLATDELVRGDVGVAGADAICAGVAKALPFERWTFKALLSTPSMDAASRLPAEGKVFIYDGRLVSKTMREFVVGYWRVGARYTQTGLDVRATVTTPEGAVESNVFAWTGTADGGVHDAVRGSCAGWTSTARDAAGAGIDTSVSAQQTLERDLRSCGRLGRLVCFGTQI